MEKYKNIVYLFSATIILFLLTFPALNPVIQTGLDGSYFLAINHFFSSGLQFGSDVFTTYGPLGFLKHPLLIGNNFILAFIIISIIRLSFISLSLYLLRLRNYSNILALVLIYILCNFLKFDHIYYGLLIILILLHHNTKKDYFIYFASLVAAVSLLIKANIGVISILFISTYFIISFLYYKNYKRVLLYFLALIVLYFLTWVIIYGNLGGSIGHLFGWIHYSLGNSVALAIDVKNNYILLAISTMLLAAVPIIEKEKRSYFIYALFALAFLATYKYAFARQDNHHVKALIELMVLFIFVYIIYAKKIRDLSIGLLILSTMFFYRNAHLTGHYNVNDNIQFIGLNNFFDVINNYNHFRTQNTQISSNNQKTITLSDSLINLIGNNSVDFMPFEISYFYKYNLNYSPRPVFMTGAYTKWLDNLNAKHINEGKSAKYIIWELTDFDKGLTIYDNRYLLNSDANFIFQFFNSYNFIYKENNINLFSISNEQLFDKITYSENIDGSIGQWIEVPETHGYVRAIVPFKKTIKGKLLSFFYRDTELYIEYKFDNDLIIKHRFDIANAKGGLWINPYIELPNKEMKGNKVKSIRFIDSSKNKFLKYNFSLVWQFLNFKDKNKDIYSTNILYSEHKENFENYNHSSIVDKSNIGTKSFLISNEIEFGPLYSLQIDSLVCEKHLTFLINASIFSSNELSALYTITVSKNNETVQWHSFPLNTNFIINNWNEIQLSKSIGKLSIDSEVKIYIWNFKNEEFNIDYQNIKLFIAD